MTGRVINWTCWDNISLIRLSYISVIWFDAIEGRNIGEIGKKVLH